MKLKVIQRGVSIPSRDMQEDMLLLEKLTCNDHLVLHLYNWAPCISFGVLLKPETWLDVAKCQELNFPLYKRPTGGGIIFHLNDISFGLIVPKSHPAYSLPTLEKYRWVNEKVASAIHSYLGEKSMTLQMHPHIEDKVVERFCLAHPTQYDIMLNGLKVGGAAQRKIKTGFLHQGTITLSLPPKALLRELLKEEFHYLAERMHAASRSLLSTLPTEEVKKNLKKHLIRAFRLCDFRFIETVIRLHL